MNLGSYLSMLITECRRLGLINPTHTVPIKVDTSAKYSDEEIFFFYSILSVVVKFTYCFQKARSLL